MNPLLCRALLLLAAVAGCASAPALSTSADAPQPPLFVFHSNMWVNLHHFLYVTARARGGLDATRAAVTASLADTVGFGRLTAGQREVWTAAVAYYQRAVAPRDILFDSSLVDVNNRLAAAEGAMSVRGAGLDPELAAALDRAAPVYRTLWWPGHDAANAAWTAAARALLAGRGAATARDEARIFHHPWLAGGVRVDVVAYANWAGAYTTEQPAHVNIASLHPDNGGTYAYEALFHEVLHTMDDSLFAAIATAFRAAGKRYPRDPTHPFIFFTAGELTRRMFADHVPYADHVGMWTRNSDYARMLPLLREHWTPYLDGRIPLADAVRKIAGAY